MVRIKYVGNGEYTTGYRTYKQYWIEGKSILKLIAWTQRRCEICQRFLSIHQLKYCYRCNVNSWIIHSTKRRKHHREYYLKKGVLCIL